jgi:predicted ABC-type ATPase
VRERPPAPRVYVLAGVNGAGKSSIGGAMLAKAGVEFFNPDEVARKFLASVPGMTQEEANGAAWEQGRRLLERAIKERKDFAFETTLGGNSIAALLQKAIAEGIEVRIGMWDSKARNCTWPGCGRGSRSEATTFRRPRSASDTRAAD